MKNNVRNFLQFLELNMKYTLPGKTDIFCIGALLFVLPRTQHQTVKKFREVRAGKCTSP